MTQLADLDLGTVAQPVASVFGPTPGIFWTACTKVNGSIRNLVAIGAFQDEVNGVLIELNRDEKAVPALGELLLARPGNKVLRDAVRIVSAEALAYVSELRYEIEAKIEAALTSAQAEKLRDNLESIDELMKAVTAYKGMHDALHVLQPLLPLLQGAASKRERWPELRAYPNQFRAQLRQITKAANDLIALGRNQQLGFREEIEAGLATLDKALNAGVDYDVSDAASEIASSVTRGLDTVDVLMLATAEEASAPLQLAADFLTPLVETSKGTDYAPIVEGYVEFAEQMSSDLGSAIKEHGRWQQLDRDFEQLHRMVVESQPAPPTDIERIWRVAARQLDTLCAGPPIPEWASGIAILLKSARTDFTPPIVAPLGDAVRDRVSALISDGRNRFMAVDEALLDWLGRSVAKQPQLLSLLKGEIVDV